MALTLEGNGFFYTLPETLDLREISQSVALDSQRLVGRRGEVAARRHAVGGAQEFVLSGALHSGAPGWMGVTLNELAEALYSGELLLTDDQLSRATRVRLKTFAYRRIGGSFAQILQISARFVALDGGSQGLSTQTHTATITPLTAGAVVRNVVFEYAGTAPIGACVNVALASGAT